jgi:UDP-N-acetyl-D-galactosamine dehydrogenase
MKDKIAVIGLGYVGLPLAISLSKFYKVEGFDISEQRINQLKNKLDINKEIDCLELKNSNISYHHIKEILKKNFDVFIVTVPTPVNNKNKPSMGFNYPPKSYN